LLAASGYDRCEHGIEHWGFENGRDFLTGWVTVSVPRRTILLGPVGAAERNQDMIDWHSAVSEANKADQERLEVINSNTSSLGGLSWCIMEQTGGFVEPWFFSYIYLYLLLKVIVTFVRSHILAALLCKIRAFWNLTLCQVENRYWHF
jgi:hypothetical protein